MNLVANGEEGWSLLDHEVNGLYERLVRSGWPPCDAWADARTACGARWSQGFGRHVYIGYADAPREGE